MARPTGKKSYFPSSNWMHKIDLIIKICSSPFIKSKFKSIYDIKTVTFQHVFIDYFNFDSSFIR